MAEDLYVPTAEDYNEAEAAEMQAACAGTDLSDPDAPAPLGFVAAAATYKSSPRTDRPVTLVCIHTAEGARTARSLAAFFQRSDVYASAHAAVDANETLQMVPYSRAAWTLRSGNPISDNLEICGFARWTRAQWMSTGTVDGCVNPRRMLHRTADWIASRCTARGIPVRHLTLTQVRAGSEGVIHHDDWTKAMRDGTHWDVGTGFPWDYVLELARGTEEDEMTPADRELLESIKKRAELAHYQAILNGRVLRAFVQREAVNDAETRAALDELEKALAAHDNPPA